MTGFGIFLIVVGIAIRYFLDRDTFNRTNQAGVQAFKSFEHLMGNRMLRFLAKLFGAAVMMLGTLLIFIDSI